jgi:hypothetical protein
MSAVTVICDPFWNGSEQDLAALAPLWLVESAQSRMIFDRLPQPNDLELTIFSGADTPESSCAWILSDVELHHGPWSTDCPCEKIRVIGARVTEEVAAAVEEIGFLISQADDNGFVAERRSPR